MADSDRFTDKKDPRRESLDDFWNIDRLIPERSGRRFTGPSRPTPTAVEVELPAPKSASVARSQTPMGITDSHQEGEKPVETVSLTVMPPAQRLMDSRPDSGAASTEITHYVPPHTADEDKKAEPILDYRPDGVLLRRVQVYEWPSNFHYFDQFTKDAERFNAMSPTCEAPPQGFFSYFPQYVQMNRRQVAWYIWWRERVRHGNYPDTDYAYVLLYIFELINLPADEDQARIRRDLLASVWMAYRYTYRQLDHYMCEWLCDYCLIHGLTAPATLLAPAMDDILAGSRLKEFYLISAIDISASGTASESAAGTVDLLLRHCCQYDYRKSKFAQGEHRGMYDRVIPGAVAACLPLLFGREGQPPAVTMQDSSVIRDAYTGALCSYRNKRRIEVAYVSFSRSHELRFLMGDMVKHVENRLRSWIGVRSRLSVMALPTPLRDALDAYLAPLAPERIPSSASTKKKEQPRPTYEALYDLPQKPVSLSDAEAIEAASWATTRILTEAFGGEGKPEEIPLVQPPPSVCVEPLPTCPTESVYAPPDAPSGSAAEALFGTLTPFVAAALTGDRAAQRAVATAARKMPDALADAINAITAEQVFFDIILEEDGGGGYRVIDDYRAELTAMGLQA